MAPLLVQPGVVQEEIAPVKQQRRPSTATQITQMSEAESTFYIPEDDSSESQSSSEDDGRSPTTSPLHAFPPIEEDLAHPEAEAQITQQKDTSEEVATAQSQSSHIISVAAAPEESSTSLAPAVTSGGLKTSFSANFLTSEPTPILKRCHSDPAFINEKKRGAWKVLPKLKGSVSSEILEAQQLEDPPLDVPRRRSSVTFDKVIIREYDQCCGDNPSVSYGPPISLDWKYQEYEAIDVDSYEDKRGQRRTLRQMVLSYYQRRNVLTFYYGASDEDLRKAKKQVKREHARRSLTRNLMPFMKVEDALESAVRKSKRIFSSGKQ